MAELHRFNGITARKKTKRLHPKASTRNRYVVLPYHCRPGPNSRSRSLSSVIVSLRSHNYEEKWTSTMAHTGDPHGSCTGRTKVIGICANICSCARCKCVLLVANVVLSEGAAGKNSKATAAGQCDEKNALARIKATNFQTIVVFSRITSAALSLATVPVYRMWRGFNGRQVPLSIPWCFNQSINQSFHPLFNRSINRLAQTCVEIDWLGWWIMLTAVNQSIDHSNVRSTGNHRGFRRSIDWLIDWLRVLKSIN